MNGEFRNLEQNELKAPASEGFRDIKPEKGMTMDEADKHWDGEFEKARGEVGTGIPQDQESLSDSDNKELADELGKTFEVKEKNEIHEGNGVQNKIDGCRREEEVHRELSEKYPKDAGYKIIPEAYLRNTEGNLVKDRETGTARRIDFVVAKNDLIVDMVEVTSKTAPKVDQLSKEYRIREAGGAYIRGEGGNMIRIPNNVETRVERRD